MKKPLLWIWVIPTALVLAASLAMPAPAQQKGEEECNVMDEGRVESQRQQRPSQRVEPKQVIAIAECQGIWAQNVRVKQVEW